MIAFPPATSLAQAVLNICDRTSRSFFRARIGLLTMATVLAAVGWSADVGACTSAAGVISSMVIVASSLPRSWRR